MVSNSPQVPSSPFAVGTCAPVDGSRKSQYVRGAGGLELLESPTELEQTPDPDPPETLLINVEKLPISASSTTAHNVCTCSNTGRMSPWQ